MNKASKIIAPALSLLLLNLPLFARTALEQAGTPAPAEDFSLPAPQAEYPGQPPSAVTAQQKLALFDYNKADALSFTRLPGAARENYFVEDLELRVADATASGGGYIQKYTYYRTYLPGPRPTVIIPMHFMGQKSVSDWAAMYFAKNGYNAVLIIPQGSLTDKTRPLIKMNELLQQEVVAGRMCVDLLETFPEADREKLYAFGISMGAIRAVLLFGVEQRIKKAGEIAGGGDLPGIVADTQFNALEKVRNARMKAEGLATIEDFRAYVTGVMKFDPLDFGCLRAPEDLIMVMGNNDNFVPDLYQEKLYAAFSRPGEGRYPSVVRTGQGHLITSFQFRKHIDRFIKFFEGR